MVKIRRNQQTNNGQPLTKPLCWDWQQIGVLNEDVGVEHPLQIRLYKPDHI